MDFIYFKRRCNKLTLFSRYADAVLADTEVFQEKLVKEMNDLIKKHFDDESVPEVSQSDLFKNVLLKHKLLFYYYYY